ncbi:hypothetical protein [Gymnodinialimonas hymeniacidonis]|uniref:hypothetical protein n=1 Tax=Gymnodinialimonas hymeniacidonis TaxID=3126508 RepID=UPI0034C6D08E
MPPIRRQILNAALLGMVSAVPAAAQSGSDLFPVPEGCTAFLTVQSRSCLVSHHWRCDSDPEGSHWRVTLDQDGPFYLNYTDAEFRWLQAFNLRTGSRDVLIEPEEDPASMAELLETGNDTMVFSIREERAEGIFQRDYTGFDRLTGDEIAIDGRSLLVTEFAYQWETTAGPRRTEGTQFVSREMGLFFGGLETVTTPGGETFEGNYSPVEFHEAGDPDFLTTQPEYDCGDMMSALPLDPVWRVAQ